MSDSDVGRYPVRTFVILVALLYGVSVGRFVVPRVAKAVVPEVLKAIR